MQAAVKAVQEAQKAARTNSEALPATPSLLNEQQSASAVSTGALQGGAQSASVNSGGAEGTTSGTAHNNQVDADSSAKDGKSKDATNGAHAPANPLPTRQLCQSAAAAPAAILCF